MAQARSNEAKVTALLLAGNRPGRDTLADAFGVEGKALVPVAGEAMLSRVARTLLDEPRIGRIIILSQDTAMWARHGETAWLAAEPRISFEPTTASVSASVAEACFRHSGAFPFLLATADNVLLTAEMLGHFLDAARAAGTDAATGVVEKKVLEAAYPGNRRTWLRFRGGSYSGANLFYFANQKVMHILRLWQGIEHQRKKARAIIGAFGPLILIGVSLRLLSLRRALRLAGRRLGVTVEAIELPWAEACIDVDKVSDYELASRILEQRGG